jgi:hypothetical protein
MPVKTALGSSRRELTLRRVKGIFASVVEYGSAVSLAGTLEWKAFPSQEAAREFMKGLNPNLNIFLKDCSSAVSSS